MEAVKKVLILYHSRAGSTRTIAEIYKEKLTSYSVKISPINLEYDYEKLINFDFLIFAFPTYHCSPSKAMMEFVQKIPVFENPKKAFTFTTYGLYSGNTLREFIKLCSSKNLCICGYSAYRSPAADGTLLLPGLPFMYTFKKRIAVKLRKDINKVENIVNRNNVTAQIPRFKFYSILNYPNKALGKKYKHKIYLQKDKCVKCNKCIDECIRKCWSINAGYPEFNGDNCEFCFKCIHHCPREAILLSSKTIRKKKLNEKFYHDYKQEIINKLI